MKTFFNISGKKAEEDFSPLGLLRTQNKDTLGQILAFLPKKTSVELAAKTSFFANSLRACRQKIERTHLSQVLFDGIDCGNESHVREILDKLKASHPDLLSWQLSSEGKTTFFTDHAGRTFHDVTPLKFAAWNLDTPMRNLLSSFMTETEVALQLNELDSNGIHYSMPLSSFKRLVKIAPKYKLPVQHNTEILELHNSKDVEENSEKCIVLNEKHYDWSFRIFQSALKTYILAAKSMTQKNRYDMDRLKKLWLDVGFTQRYLSVPCVNAYYCDICFARQPNFNTVTLDRKTTFKINNKLINNKKHFFDILDNLELGFSFAIYKGFSTFPRAHRAPYRLWNDGGGLELYSPEYDLKALSRFYKVRTDNYNVLIKDMQLASSRPAIRF